MTPTTMKPSVLRTKPTPTSWLPRYSRFAHRAKSRYLVLLRWRSNAFASAERPRLHERGLLQLSRLHRSIQKPWRKAERFLNHCADSEREGRLLPDERTPGGRRRYDLVRLRPELFHAPEPQRRTIAYARVSRCTAVAPARTKMKNRYLARSIADMSFFELRRQLEYKLA